MASSTLSPPHQRISPAHAGFEHFGNSESVHAFAQAAAGALQAARQTVADVLGCRPAEVVFTGSGSEACNLALRCAAWAARWNDGGNRLVTTPIEHHALGHTVDHLRDRFGFEVIRVAVDGNGCVSPDDVAAVIRPETALVSMMAAKVLPSSVASLSHRHAPPPVMLLSFLNPLPSMPGAR